MCLIVVSVSSQMYKLIFANRNIIDIKLNIALDKPMIEPDTAKKKPQ